MRESAMANLEPDSLRDDLGKTRRAFVATGAILGVLTAVTAWVLFHFGVQGAIWPAVGLSISSVAFISLYLMSRRGKNSSRDM